MKIDSIEARVYTVPTDEPESDGTLEWDSTTMVLALAQAGGLTGLGYTYSHAAAGILIKDKLAPEIIGRNPMNIAGIWDSMIRSVRNLGQPGLAATAISAVDNALWDLKAKILNVPLVSLIGACREAFPIYGSGGFTSYSLDRLGGQLSGWVGEGIPRVKMKVGRHPEEDIERVRVAREAIGPQAELFVDANSAYSRKQALHYMERFAGEFGVRWMEQPLAPQDRAGMRYLREHAPSQMDVTDGEYGYELSYFRRMIGDGAADVVMADATRCCGITGFLKAGAVCEAWKLPMSSHCAPLLHMHPGCCLPAIRHGEYFHDHVRIERLFFDGMPRAESGALKPDLSRPGLGVTFKEEAAEPYRRRLNDVHH